MTLQLGERRVLLKADDIFLVNVGKQYSFEGSGDLFFANIMFPYGMIGNLFEKGNVFFACDSSGKKEARYEALKGKVRQLLQRHLQTGGSSADFQYTSLIYAVLDLLTKNFLWEDHFKGDSEKYNNGDERMDQINLYIRKNYNQSISITDLAGELFLSTGHLSRLFKKQYGMSFTEYLAAFRMRHAVEDLIYTDMPVTKLAFANGFSNLTLFNRLFKEAYQDTPSNFRKKEQAKRQMQKEDGLDATSAHRLGDFLLHNRVPEGEDEKIRYITAECFAGEAKDAAALPKLCRTVNIGKAADLLDAQVQEHIRILKKYTEIEYLRFWNIFSPELLLQPGKNTLYNFSRLDRILDFIRELGLKPHMDLCPKIELGVVNIQGWSGSFSDLPAKKSIPSASLEERIDAYEALIRHLHQRYENELNDWRIELSFNYEFWNCGNEIDTYLEQFCALYEMVRRHSPGCMVGGCGILWVFKEHTIDQLFQRWRSMPCQPDFLSGEVFSYVLKDAGQDLDVCRSQKEDFSLRWLNGIRKKLSDFGLEDCPVLFSEWNQSFVNRNYLNDTVFKGSWLIKNRLDLYGLVEDVGYFMGSDLFSEDYDSNRLLFGGTGMVTKDGILKPAGYACQYLNRMYPYAVSRGEGYLLTTDQKGSFRMVCHNMQSLGANYYETQEDMLIKEDMDRYFEEQRELEFRLQIKDLTQGEYRIRLHRVSDKTGSILDSWKEMDFETEISASDIEYIRRICCPRISIQKQKATEDGLTVAFGLYPNSFAYVEIKPI